jgi:hypothetical protein
MHQYSPGEDSKGRQPEGGVHKNMQEETGKGRDQGVAIAVGPSLQCRHYGVSTAVTSY